MMSVYFVHLGENIILRIRLNNETVIYIKCYIKGCIVVLVCVCNDAVVTAWWINCENKMR